MFLFCGLSMLSLLVFALPTHAQSLGVSVTCDNGARFDNGVEIIINQMRSGFTYTATVIGLNGFDPVLAVLDTATGTGLCEDDVPAAASYQANLPTTGSVAGNNLSAQVRFNQSSAAAFADVSLVVGGLGNTSGEFLLFVEGMGVTAEDNAGDPFSIRLTPGVVAAGEPIHVYMLTRGQVDPLMSRIDADFNVVTDSSGSLIACDDAGDSNLCWGSSSNLSNSFVVTEQGRTSGSQYNAMLSLPVAGIQLDPNPDLNFFNLLFSSYQQQTTGQYILAFHVRTADTPVTASSGGATDPKGGDPIGSNTQQQQAAPQQPAQPRLPAGMSVTCDNGVTFDNGVEIRVIQMRSGFNYTATAIGLNGFDPVLAVLGSSGEGLCYDDVPEAARYEVNLPSTGRVAANNLSAQVVFNHNDPSGFQDISLVVGGFGNTTGEFVLMLEGMAVTEADVYGDPFRVFVTPGMVASRTPLTVYMISRENQLDPYMAVTDGGTTIVNDDTGAMMACDDAGNTSLCWGNSSSLNGTYVTTINGQLPGNQYDAMMSFDLSTLQLFPDPSQNFFNLIFSSYQASSLGQYVVAFHMGTSATFSPDA
jgi:hypothetical protein